MRIDTGIDTEAKRNGTGCYSTVEKRENRAKYTKKEPTLGGFFMAPQVGLEPTTLRLTEKSERYK